jgi:hypothetical protein
MVIVLVLVVSAALLALMVVYLTHRRHLDLRQHAIQVQQLQKFPAAAFMNLSQPSELEYVRLQLAPSVFQQCRRKRARVLIAYVRLILRDTRVILQCADRAAASADASIAEPAHELMNLALQTRLNALKALCLLYLGIFFPSIDPSLASTVQGFHAAHDKSFALSARILR